MASLREGYVTANNTAWPPCVDLKRVPYRTKQYEILALNKDTMVWRDLTQQPAVVRKLYYGRGPISWWREHLFAFRVEREYHALSYLAKRGIACSEPVEWSRGYDAYLGHRYEVLTTKEIAHARDFGSLWHDENISFDEKFALLQQCMQLIRQMHDAGFYHGALYVRNILVQPAEAGRWVPYIIDTPKAVPCYKNLVGDPLTKVDLSHFMKTFDGVLSNAQLLETLASYGMENHAAQRFILHLHTYKETKHSRNKERAYASWRSLWVRKKA